MGLSGLDHASTSADVATFLVSLSLLQSSYFFYFLKNFLFKNKFK